MMKLRRLIERALSFSSQHLWAFMLLSFGAIIQAFNVVLFDSMAGGLYLGHFGQMDLSFNFFIAAFFIFCAGLFVVKHTRFLNKDFLLFLLMATFLQAGLMYTITHHLYLSYDLMFCIKWAYRIVLFVGFWNCVFRFIELNLKSKRFLFIVLCELFGWAFGGIFLYFACQALSVQTLFVLLISSTVLLTMILLKVAAFEKITPETQQRKKSGIDEPVQKKLMYLIYTTAFFFAGSFSFIEYVLYQAGFAFLSPTTETFIRFIGLVWFLTGAFALFLLLFFYEFRRLLSITTPLIILCFLPIISALGFLAQIFWIVIFTKVCLELILYFCMGYYFRMLSRPLSYALKGRLKTGTFLVAVPAGFALTGLVFYFLPFAQSAIFLGGVLSISFLCLLYDDQHEYAKALLYAFKTYRWRGGRLIITNKHVLKYITKKAESQDATEAIYYLRVLEEAQVLNLKRYLHHALGHPDPMVRCFALECIERHNMRMFKKTLSDVMDKDTDNRVRQKALEVFCSLGEKYAVEKAILYMDDVRFKKGALIGLLKEGGEGTLIASEGLTKLVRSAHPHNRLMAAEILTAAPRKGFFRLVLTLMKDKDLAVQKKAILAAGYNKHPALLDVLLEKLSDLRVQDEVITALNNYGSVAYSKIKEALDEHRLCEFSQKNLIRFLWISTDLKAKYILLNVLKKLPINLRLYAMTFLSQSELFLSRKNCRRIFVPLIEMDFKQALTTLLLIQDLKSVAVLEDKTCFDLLANSLYDDFMLIRANLLTELSFVYTDNLMKQATQILKNVNASPEEKKVALATTDDILPKKYHPLRLIMQDNDLAVRLGNLPVHLIRNKAQFNQQFAFILKGMSYRSLWTKICALTCIRRLNDTSVVADVAMLLTDKNAQIRWYALWALDTLVQDKKNRKNLFLPLVHDENKDVSALASSLLV